MKLHIYLVDYFKEVKDHGLNTYITQLGSGLEKNNDISLTYAWVDSKYLNVTTEDTKQARSLHIPAFSSQFSLDSNADEHLSNALLNDIKDKKNVIIHLNWIVHCPVAWHLKQKVECRIVLTKHCIPWRDFVNNNLKDFYKLNKAYEKNRRFKQTVPQLQHE